MIKDETRISIWGRVRRIRPESKDAQDRRYERREIRNLVEHGAVRAISHRVEANFEFDCSVHKEHWLNNNWNE